MDFKKYQEEALKTAVYPNMGNNIVYPVLGLAGETGEIAEKIKKIIRDKNGIMDEETKDALTRELGDVLWYAAAFCSELGINLEDAAKMNLDKLRDRQTRNVIHGQGDNR